MNFAHNNCNQSLKIASNIVIVVQHNYIYMRLLIREIQVWRLCHCVHLNTFILSTFGGLFLLTHYTLLCIDFQNQTKAKQPDQLKVQVEIVHSFLSAGSDLGSRFLMFITQELNMSYGEI